MDLDFLKALLYALADKPVPMPGATRADIRAAATQAYPPGSGPPIPTEIPVGGGFMVAPYIRSSQPSEATILPYSPQQIPFGWPPSRRNVRPDQMLEWIELFGKPRSGYYDVAP